LLELAFILNDLSAVSQFHSQKQGAKYFHAGVGRAKIPAGSGEDGHSLSDVLHDRQSGGAASLRFLYLPLCAN
jgi:hypothetical protein